MRPLIEVEGLTKHYALGTGFFSRGRRVIHAVDDVSFCVESQTTVGLVGESGCGKTTIARLLLLLTEPTSGVARFEGQDIFALNKEELREFRRQAQMVFQDPFASLNPRKRVRQILSIPLLLKGMNDKHQIEETISHLLELVGLAPASSFIDRYPHELSGGQRQRIGIARAISSRPKFIVADEPFSSLDVSVRAQMIIMMKKIQQDFDLTQLFITHDLSVLRTISDKVIVMYLGNIMEVAKTQRLFENPLHPYTQALLSATPIPNPDRARKRDRIILSGDVPSPISPPSGCRFHTRCASRMPICETSKPELVEAEHMHFVACH